MSFIGGHNTTLLSRSSLLFMMLNMNKWATVPLLPESAVIVVVLFAQLCLAPCDPMNQRLTKLLCPWNSPGKSTGGDGNSLLQGILPTQGSNADLLCCRQNLYWLSHQGSPLSNLTLSLLSPSIYPLKPIPLIICLLNELRLDIHFILYTKPSIAYCMRNFTSNLRTVRREVILYKCTKCRMHENDLMKTLFFVCLNLKL